MIEIPCQKGLDQSPLAMEMKRKDIVGNIREPCLTEAGFCAFVLLTTWGYIMFLIII